MTSLVIGTYALITKVAHKKGDKLDEMSIHTARTAFGYRTESKNSTLTLSPVLGHEHLLEDWKKVGKDVVLIHCRQDIERCCRALKTKHDTSQDNIPNSIIAVVPCEYSIRRKCHRRRHRNRRRSRRRHPLRWYHETSVVFGPHRHGRAVADGCVMSGTEGGCLQGCRFEMFRHSQQPVHTDRGQRCRRG